MPTVTGSEGHVTLAGPIRLFLEINLLAQQIRTRRKIYYVVLERGIFLEGASR